jgi:hypothetical protein
MGWHEEIEIQHVLHRCNKTVRIRESSIVDCGQRLGGKKQIRFSAIARFIVPSQKSILDLPPNVNFNNGSSLRLEVVGARHTDPCMLVGKIE